MVRNQPGTQTTDNGHSAAPPVNCCHSSAESQRSPTQDWQYLLSRLCSNEEEFIFSRGQNVAFFCLVKFAQLMIDDIVSVFSFY